jgi:hypothetical protein
LRQYAASQNAMGTISDEVTWYFSWLNPSICTVSNRNAYQESSYGCKVDTWPVCELTVHKMWELQFLTMLCASKACCRDSFTFFYRYNTFNTLFAKLFPDTELTIWAIVLFAWHCNSSVPSIHVLDLVHAYVIFFAFCYSVYIELICWTR